jgi:ligand-binding sensor domain-containing protein
MIKYVPVYALLLMFVFCTSSKGQTDRPTATIRFESKDVISSHGPTTSVRTIQQDKKGNMWLASNEGIIRYDGKSFTNITGNLFPACFFSLLEDRQGNFWFGNFGSGVYYYDGKSLRNFTTAQGLVDNEVMCFYEDRAGMIWIGTRRGASLYDGKSFRNFTSKEGFSSIAINSIIEDKKGKLWFGTSGSTYVYDGKTFTVFTSKDGKAFNNVWSIIEDKRGNIWLGGGDGLWRYDGRTFTNFTENFVSYVYEDKKGNIWTSGGSDNGQGFALSRYDEKSLSTNKPTVTQITQSLNLFGILEAADGSIWFGAFDGVYRYDGKTITDFKGKQVQK